MKIVYFNRQQGSRFSIEKVTSSIIEEVSKGADVKSLMVPDLRANFRGIINNIRFVRTNRIQDGVNHITGDVHYCILGLIGCKAVLTIHDTVFLTVKQNKISYFIKWLLWLFLPCLLADKVVCISNKTLEELKKHHIPTKNVSVIYDPVTIVNVEKVKEEHAKAKILHIGTKPNKNLPRVIESLKGLDCELTIVGKLMKGDEELLKQNGIDYKNLIGISEEHLAEIYIDSDIVSFPSLYEGFGMPIIEGQLSGSPVLTSKISPMTEVGEDSVYYVDPYDVTSMRSGFVALLENPSLSEDLISRGKKNAMRFSPEIIASKYIELYKEIR